MRVLIGMVLLWVATSAMADVAGSRDLEVLPRYPGSQIVSFKEVAAQERIYPQGPIRRISGRLRYESEISAAGHFTSLTYELPRNHTSAEVFAVARETLQAKGAELLYWCEGRECGSSSLWANAVFDNATLTGADDQQAYALLRLAEPADSLLALYSITRGNRRAYLQAEQLQGAVPLGELLPTPATLLRQLRNTGELNLLRQDEPSEAWVAVLARSLNLDSTLRVSLGGAQAEAWREALVAQRVRAARLELGEAAPQGLQIKLLR
jgi:hypothetical protein